MPLDLTPVMDKARNTFLSLAMSDKALPTAFIVLGIILIIHSMEPVRTTVQVEPVGATFLSESVPAP